MKNSTLPPLGWVSRLEGALNAKEFASATVLLAIGNRSMPNGATPISGDAAHFVDALAPQISWLGSRYQDAAFNYIACQPEETRRKIGTFWGYALRLNGSEFSDLLNDIWQKLNFANTRRAFDQSLKNGEKLSGAHLLAATQFFTPSAVANFVTSRALADSCGSEAVVDPACGVGAFLASAVDARTRSVAAGKKANFTENLLYEKTIGYDLDPDVAEICRLHLVFKGVENGCRIPPAELKVHSGGAEYGFLSDSVPVNLPQSYDLLHDLRARRKIILTNPPFAGRRDIDDTLRRHLRENFPTSGGDLCVAFMLQCVNMLGPADRAGFVSQKSWMHLKSFEGFRRHLLERSTLVLCADVGTGIFSGLGGEKSSVALSIVSGRPPKNADELSFLKLYDLDVAQRMKALSTGAISADRLLPLQRQDLLKREGCVMRYEAWPGARKTKGSVYGDFAKPMQGTSTGDNASFVAYAWTKADDPRWKLVSKGGGHSKWQGLNIYRVFWGENGEIIGRNPGSALRNIERIDSTQLVYSDTGPTSFSVRVLLPGQVFIASGPGIRVVDGHPMAHAAFLNSRVARWKLKRLSPKLTVSAGYISQIPVSKDIIFDEDLSLLGAACLKLKRTFLEKKIRNSEYRFTKIAGPTSEAVISEIITDLSLERDRLLAEGRIECLIGSHLELSEEEFLRVYDEIGAPVASLPFKSIKTRAADLDTLMSKALGANCECLNRGRALANGGEGLLERLSIFLNAHPTSTLEWVRKNLEDLPLLRLKYLEDILHKAVLSGAGYTSGLSIPPAVINSDQAIESVHKHLQGLDQSAAPLGPKNADEWVRHRFQHIHAEAFLKSPPCQLVFKEKSWNAGTEQVCV